MGNFAVAASEDIIRKGNDLLDKVSEPGDRKQDALNHVFDMAISLLDDDAMKHSGVDVEALDASIASIRSQFLALIDGKKQIIAKKDALLQEEKTSRAQKEAEMKEQMETARTAQEAAEKAAQEAKKDVEQARRDADAARDQAASSASLVEEKDKRIHTLEGLLAAADEKAASCEQLQKDKSDVEAKVQSLLQQLRDQKNGYEQQISTLKKDQETQIRELNAEMDRRVSDASKDALLAQEKALSAQERELNKSFMEQLRKADKESARLQVTIEDLQAQLAELTADAGEEDDPETETT